MWLREIGDIDGSTGGSFRWRKYTRFVGMYQYCGRKGREDKLCSHVQGPLLLLSMPQFFWP
jgi:hypothetical protein